MHFLFYYYKFFIADVLSLWLHDVKIFRNKYKNHPLNVTVVTFPMKKEKFHCVYITAIYTADLVTVQTVYLTGGLFKITLKYSRHFSDIKIWLKSVVFMVVPQIIYLLKTNVIV